jgi:hypothetical protein
MPVSSESISGIIRAIREWMLRLLLSVLLPRTLFAGVRSRLPISADAQFRPSSGTEADWQRIWMLDSCARAGIATRLVMKGGAEKES